MKKGAASGQTEAKQNGGNAYVELQVCFLNLEQGRSSEADYLRKALNLLLKRERIRLDKDSWEFLEAECKGS